ncbi:MAG TPA: alpha/beta hydrolase-fold protein [Tepidisphaeraceae bacterium]
MLRIGLAVILLLIVSASTTAQPSGRGEITKYVFDHSKIFPGTLRNYWVYVPAEYDGKKPACLLVDQDGIQFKAPRVLDELIAKGEMPVTIGVFVQPGVVPASSEKALPRFNRSVEYDGLGDSYVRFLVEELLPEVERKTTKDGRAIRISHAATDRAIMGSSSGGIAAFTAAWERPDQFSRVFSAIGTYVNQRGGNIYPSLIRKFEPKAIRVFLQDGSTDHNLVGGNWFLANQEMESALSFAGYEVNHAWGTGDHDTKQATEIFPDVMRWLWKDWPTPPKAALGSEPLQQVLIPGEGWKPVVLGMEVPTGKLVVTGKNISYRIDEQGIYRGGSANGLVDSGAKRALALSPDQSLLYADDDSYWVWSYQIQADGSLKYKQQFYDLYVPDTSSDAGAGGMCVDRKGRLYVATHAGIQVCDQAGRVIAIVPILGEPISNVWLGGKDSDELFAQSTRGFFVRKVNVRGVNSIDPPIKPTAPRL